MYRIGQEEIDAVARVINSKALFKTLGNETVSLEKELREYFNAENVIVMTSGMASLVSALVGMGIGPGDEVIVPAYTYIATAFAVLTVGAIPVVAEIDESLMLDASDVEKKITSRTKAVIPVHMKGYPVDMDKLMLVAKKHNILVLEDACQAVGGSFKGKKLGTIGDVGSFSFNYFKNISAGEGGALLTNNKKIFETSLIYHDSCAVKYFGNQMEGFTTGVFCGNEYRTNEITAAILRVQLTRLSGIIEDLRKNKKYLMEKLSKYYNFIPSNDPEGECSNVLTFKFDTPEEAIKVRDKGLGLSIPAYLDKHVYCFWDPLFLRKGACHPLMNPFNMEANKNAPIYTKDMCQKSVEILAKCAHFELHPDLTKEDLDAIAKKFIDAKN